MNCWIAAGVQSLVQCFHSVGASGCFCISRSLNMDFSTCIFEFLVCLLSEGFSHSTI